VETTRYVSVPMLVPTPERGRWELGGGPVYFHGVGATVVGGYMFAGHKWQVLAGPMWVPQNDTPEYAGIASKGCAKVPYTAPGHEAAHPLGGQALVIYSFGK
jgi:hypothetical protein